MSTIEFDSAENVILLNPRMPADQADRLRSWLRVADHLTGHVFVLTSGSTATSEAEYKWVALSKAAILASAKAVNTHFASTHRNTWIHCLPEFHVGGIGIFARARLSGAKVVRLEGRWEPRRFIESWREAQFPMASLVPAQVHDLVELGQAPARPDAGAILVGGGALASDLYHRAWSCGYPVYPSYGLTETASAIAVAPSRPEAGDEPVLELLSHARATSDPETGRLRVQGDSLLAGYVSLDAAGEPRFWDPKDSDGWFTTEDVGNVAGRTIRIDGRVQDRIKIGGETTHLASLRDALDYCVAGLGPPASFALFAAPDARLGYVIELVVETAVPDEAVDVVVARYNESRLPFEHVRRIRRIGRIPHTELGKVKWGELSKGEPSS
jgi:O-succinylbenzoic acid--CoA ligase